MRARRMKSSKYKKKTRRDSSRGIHRSLLSSAAARLRRSSSSTKRDAELERVSFLPYAFHCTNRFWRGNPALFIIYSTGIPGTRHNPSVSIPRWWKADARAYPPWAGPASLPGSQRPARGCASRKPPRPLCKTHRSSWKGC